MHEFIYTDEYLRVLYFLLIAKPPCPKHGHKPPHCHSDSSSGGGSSGGSSSGGSSGGSGMYDGSGGGGSGMYMDEDGNYYDSDGNKINNFYDSDGNMVSNMDNSMDLYDENGNLIQKADSGKNVGASLNNVANSTVVGVMGTISLLALATAMAAMIVGQRKDGKKKHALVGAVQKRMGLFSSFVKRHGSGNGGRQQARVVEMSAKGGDYQLA